MRWPLPSSGRAIYVQNLRSACTGISVSSKASKPIVLGSVALGLSHKKRARRLTLKPIDRKSTRLNSSHGYISYAVFCLKKKKRKTEIHRRPSPTILSHLSSHLLKLNLLLQWDVHTI